MVVSGFLVPLKGGIASIFYPPEGKDYKWYISGIYCQLGDYIYIYATYHLLGEPETTIDSVCSNRHASLHLL